MTDETPSSDTDRQHSAEELLALIERHLPRLWAVHANTGNRSLRTVLQYAERLLAERQGVDVATFRRAKRSKK